MPITSVLSFRSACFNMLVPYMRRSYALSWCQSQTRLAGSFLVKVLYSHSIVSRCSYPHLRLKLYLNVASYFSRNSCLERRLSQVRDTLLDVVLSCRLAI